MSHAGGNYRCGNYCLTKEMQRGISAVCVHGPEDLSQGSKVSSGRRQVSSAACCVGSGVCPSPIQNRVPERSTAMMRLLSPRRVLSTGALLLLVCLVEQYAAAQVDTGALLGTVKDAT